MTVQIEIRTDAGTLARYEAEPKWELLEGMYQHGLKHKSVVVTEIRPVTDTPEARDFLEENTYLIQARLIQKFLELQEYD